MKNNKQSKDQRSASNHPHPTLPYATCSHCGEAIPVSLLGVRPVYQYNFGNNRMLKEPRIMLE